MKKIISILAVLVLIVVVANLFLSQKKQAPVVSPSYKNISYQIDGRNVTLKDGIAVEDVAPGSAEKLTTRYFGNAATGDLNADGKPDTAFLLSQDGGGSGTMYYVVAALNTGTGYVGTSAVFLGDRIAPQTTEIKDGVLIVNYADRAPGEPMTTKPSIGVSKYLKVVGTDLVNAK